ncbi:tryptophan synthase beta subunit-like PLP-dependent enzyme [Dichotomopilus funicola]|uniref:Cysteine synthase 2 n=1 Tax=Dichotomopilus funicola TaxID=1934379 RepID=A0AAN6ZQG1_9PEZI|nr:tryptophan synthase beta subunit-like PLP-dependent enzyme [Dichotomopilus funicola]
MSLSDHPRVYGTAALTVTFIAGILVTLGFKDLYPELQARYERRKRPRWRSSVFFGPVSLEDREESPEPSPSSLSPYDRGNGIVHGIEGAIGNTPLIKIRSLSEATGCTILAKAEFLNGAGGSPKDRVALNMIQVAEEQGLLTPGRGDTIYEGTVGSTGISLAVLARARGYKAHICMPDDMAIEKSDLLHHLGATVERVPVAPITDPGHFVNLARTRAKDHTAAADTPSRGFFADQFESLANYTAHMKTTGPEIYAQTGNGRLDAFVAGAGTGGTITGVAKYLKEERELGAALRVVLADPQGSGLYNKIRHGVMYSATEREGTRRRTQVDTMVEGIGITRITENFEVGRELIDDAVKVTDDQACRMARWLVEHDGIFVGSSSAVNCVAAVVTALKMPRESRVVTILCDSGTRHLSKFWKHITAMGLEDETQEQDEDLLAVLGLESLKRE